jgi:hypothetical protein
MYELYDPVTLMFFFRNKHMMCDFGTGNNNKLNWVLEDKQELIDIIETIYRGAKKGRGLVVSPKGELNFCLRLERKADDVQITPPDTDTRQMPRRLQIDLSSMLRIHKTDGRAFTGALWRVIRALRNYGAKGLVSHNEFFS